MAVVSRNDPSPCGSGRRYKHCFGADAGAGAPARRPEAAASAFPDAAPILSVVLPFYRRFPAFRQALAHNAQWFARDGLEVVIAMDDPADERELVELAQGGVEPRPSILEVSLRASQDYQVVIESEAAVIYQPVR